MRFLYQLRAIFVVAFKRLIAQPLLTVSVMLGLTVAVALVMTVPLYAEAVSYRILIERLEAADEETSRPPFAYMFYFVGAWADPVELSVADEVDTYLRGAGSAQLGLPTEQYVRHYETKRHRLYPLDTTNYRDDALIIDYMTFSMTETAARTTSKSLMDSFRQLPRLIPMHRLR